MTVAVRRRVLGAVAVLGLAFGLVLAVPTAKAVGAAAGDVGFAGPSTSGDGSAATGEKPESKLWWNDGIWWGVLFHTASKTHHIFRLDRESNRWLDTGTMVDNRPKTRSDALWDGSKLYIASHVRASNSGGAASGNKARLYRYSYDPARDAYTIDAGFPAQINNHSTETLTIDKDSTGVLWATWTQGSKVYVNNTTGGDAIWGTPFVLPGSRASGLDNDDISSVVAFAGNRIGVLWSNQEQSAVYFAEHVDGAARTSWDVTRTAIEGLGSADDHINVKAVQADGTGQVYAVVKTAYDEVGGASTVPLIMLLARDPSTGAWSSYPVARLRDCHTRPVLLVDTEHQMLYVFMTAPNSGCPYTGYPGSIFMKSSPMSNIAFPEGRGTSIMRDVLSPNLNNPTTTKQSVNSVTGMVVLASNDVTQRYWHADIPLGGTVLAAGTTQAGVSRRGQGR